jgi:3-methyladenine DNA glycosylase AlkD
MESWSTDLFNTLEAAQNPDKVPAMEAYMKHNFKYRGLSSPALAAISRQRIAAAAQLPGVDWEFRPGSLAETLPAKRSTRAISYLNRLRPRLSPADLPALKTLVQAKSWWDSVDTLSGIIGDLVLRFPELKPEMLAWSLDADMWTRRAAILHQLEYMAKTDTELLTKIILNNLGSREFFINKAIGWSLRQYAWTNPDWVAAFVREHEAVLSTLSKREATKHIPPTA